MEITELVKDLQIYTHGEEKYIKLEDAWDIALLGAFSNKQLLIEICKDINKLEELVDYTKSEGLLTKILINNFEKVGILITESNDNK